MTKHQESHSEALELAGKVANRYGRLALARAVGEAAAAERQGDTNRRDLWASAASYLRHTLQQKSVAPA
ncbi:MAG: hypothetical protein PHW63_05095 [Alphaproteobacteria bacterium]|nr:hypothetical protein [Alphaproteobacteria bacterium]